MKESTKSFLGDAAKAIAIVGLLALSRKFGVPASFTFGNTKNAAGNVCRETENPVAVSGPRWPEPTTGAEHRMLYLARSGHCANLTCSDRYAVARKIYDRANAPEVSESEKDYAATLLSLYAEYVNLTCRDRRRIIDMIDRL